MGTGDTAISNIYKNRNFNKMYSIDQIKGVVSAGAGPAKSNLFRVIMPVIPQIYINLTGASAAYPQNMNILCKNVVMPGRQITTVDRTIGVVTEKVAYGFLNDEIALTFLGLNDYAIRKYLEAWQFFCMNPDTHNVKYKTEYARNVTIQQLDHLSRVVYSITLEDAFPTQLLPIEFSNENGQPVEIAATLTYTRWRQDGFANQVISSVAQNFLEDILT